MNDLDFIADSFDFIPDTLRHDFLFHHIHPWDPPGKTLLQLIDPDSALAIHVFRAYGATMSRTSHLHLADAAIQLISLEDLVARAARLALDLAGNVPTPAKYAVDFLRLLELVQPAEIEAAWRDQRKPNQPATFEETAIMLQSLIPARKNLLINPDYSKDFEEVCTRCAPTVVFQLADPNVVLSLLGYR